MSHLRGPVRMGMDIGAGGVVLANNCRWLGQGVADACGFVRYTGFIATPGMGLSLSVDSDPSRLISIPEIGVSSQQHFRE